MSIREATINDVKTIIDMVSSLSEFYLKNKDGALPVWFSKTLQESEFNKRLVSEDYSNYVFEANGSIVGYLSIKCRSHLFHLYVLSEHQGCGIARALWDHARLISGSPIYSVRSSLFAVPVYRKFGFYVSGVAQEKEGICYQPMELRT